MLPEPIRFSKISAGGNDFICLDNTQGAFSALLASDALAHVVQRLCRRGLSVGADGVIVACERGSGHGVDIIAKFLEPDGSEAELCGNGTACFTYWVINRGLVAGPEVQILTAAGIATGRVDDEDPKRIRVCVPDPRDLALGLELDVKGERWTLDYIHTGVPHAIAFVDRLQQLDILHWGPGIRHHPRFAPRGVNANFVQVLDVGRIAIRTFEFGVEAETLACGTGSAAAAIVSALRYDWPMAYRRGETAVQVQVRGGENLRVWFVCHDDSNVTDVCLETRARPIYDGEISPELLEELKLGVRAVSEGTAAPTP